MKFRSNEENIGGKEENNLNLARRQRRKRPPHFLLLLFLILNLIHSFYPDKILASDLKLGLGAGVRKINDDYLNKIYGSGFIFIPYLELAFSELFSVEVALEGGYRKEAPIGLYKEPSVLKISGLEFSLHFHRSFKLFTPFLKIGSGYYFYRQDIESPYVRFRVNHRDISLHGAGGLQFTFHSRFFFRIETKYVYLKVRPFDQTVDLGGLRYILSLGYKI
jgi:hypothetical protein